LINSEVVLEINEADAEMMKSIISAAMWKANLQAIQINVFKTELRHNEIKNQFTIRVPCDCGFIREVRLDQTWHGSSVIVYFIPEGFMRDYTYTTLTSDVSTAYVSARDTTTAYVANNTIPVITTPTIEFVDPTYYVNQITYDNKSTIGAATVRGYYNSPEPPKKKPTIRPMDRPDFEYREEDYKELDEFLQSLA
jgi:hypothetical protein